MKGERKMQTGKMKPVITVRVANEGVFFGPGVMMILEALETHGAMKDACRQTGISYSKAWRILNEVERQLGYPVVSRQHGGSSGGGCMVTPAGQKIMSSYRESEKRIKAYADQVFEELFPHCERSRNEVVFTLAEALSVSRGDIISLTGAGGKTSCLYQLGNELQEGRVLLTTTTKMGYPAVGQVDEIYSVGEIEIPRLPHKHGRTFLSGGYLAGGKCRHVPMDKIGAASANYDVTVIEADGSRQFPLKGYFDSEPCIPEFATLNVGIATVQGIGRRADESWILRWPEFQEMVGIEAGELVNEIHMARWIEHPKGMFKGSCGRKVLFWNQVESEEQQEQAEKVMNYLDEDFRSKLARVVAGSVKNSEYRTLWKQEDKAYDVSIEG